MEIWNCSYRKNVSGKATGLLSLLAVLLILSQAAIASAATATRPTADEELNTTAPSPPRHSSFWITGGKNNEGEGATNPESQDNSRDGVDDAADDVIADHTVFSRSHASGLAPAPEYAREIVSHDIAPPTPPRQKIAAAIKEPLPISASPSADNSPATAKAAPGPDTTRDGSFTKPLLITAGVAAAVGVAVAAGGGSGSDSTASDQSSADRATVVINLANLVRIGDDEDYNANHPDHFQVSHPTGLSWGDTFTIDNVDNVSSAKFRYTVAASKVGNPVYVNGSLVEGLCNPGNLASIKKGCSMDITRFIHAGSNEIKIRCAIDPSDTITPYDDVELYDLRIELEQ